MMNESYIITATVVVISLLVFFIFKVASKKIVSDKNSYKIVESSDAQMINKEQNHYGDENRPLVSVSRVPMNVEVEESRLHEITDPNIMTRLSSLSPAIVNALGKTKTVTTTTTTKISGDYYQVSLKKGGELVKSKNMENAYRGFTRGPKGVKEQANLMKVSPTKTKKITTNTRMATSAVANVMNVASLVVGQYYMSEVNSKLEGINKSLSAISDYQKREFKSRVRSLVVNVQSISTFSEEIFEDETIRNNKLIHLQQLQEQTTQLLEQVNLEIEELIQKEIQISYEEYSSIVKTLDGLVFFQKILLRVLQEIGKLTVVFGNGKLSQESSFSLMHTYVEQIAILSDDLAVWQDQYIDNFAIDLDASKRRKQGIEGVVTNITGVIKDDWRYAKLEEGLTVKIKQQMTPDKIEWKSQETDLYQKDLQLLIKDGKTYLWLPEEIS